MLNKLIQHWDTNEKILVTYRERFVNSIKHDDYLIDWLEQPIQFKFQVPNDDNSKSLNEIFDNNKHIQIIGYAGSGKTTIVKFLAIAAATGKFKDLPNLPIIISHTSINRHRTLYSAVSKQFERFSETTPDVDFVNRLLQQGKIFLLLDGIDECSEPEKVISDVREIAEKYPLSPVVITSRTYSTKSIPNFITAKIQPFDKEEIRLITNKLCARYNVDSQKLWLNLNSNSALLSLAENPLQLHIIVRIYKEQNEKPLRINSFIENWIANLLKPENESSKQDTFRFAVKIANYLEESDKSSFAQDEIENIPDNHVEKNWVSHSSVVNSIDLLCKNGVLDAESNNRYRFTHKLLQEYFASKSLASIDTQELFQSIESDNEITSRKSFYKCLLLDEKIDNDRLVFNLLESDKVKAKSYIADLIIDNPTSTNTKVQALNRLLKEDKQSDLWIFRTCDALASLNNTSVIESCQIKLEDEKISAWESTILAYLLSMQGKTNNKVLEVLFQAARDENPSIRTRAYKALFATKSNPALVFIIDRLKTEKDESALEEILSGLINTDNLQDRISASLYSVLMSELEKRYSESPTVDNNLLLNAINKLSVAKKQNTGR